jgi:hypothetical protein
MADDRRPARVILRMTPQLRDSLRAAADEAGCSVNAFAIQVLATAAGDPARYRSTGVPAVGMAPVHDVERDHRGFPVSGRARHMHIEARSAFISELLRTMPHDEMRPIVTKFDEDDPGHFVDWYLRREEQQRPGYSNANGG